MNGLQMIETIKATGSEAEFFARWAGYYAKSANTTQYIPVLAQTQGAIPGLVSTLSTAAVLVLGGFKVMNGEMTVGMLVAYQTLLGSYMRPINTLVSFGSTLQELQADMNRLDDVIRYPADKQYEQDRQKLEYDPSVVKLSGLVELQERHLRLQPARTAAHSGFQPARRARPAGCARRIERQREVDRGEGDLRPVPELGRRGALRREATPRNPARPPRQLDRGRRSGSVPLRRHGQREHHDVGSDGAGVARRHGEPRRGDRRSDRGARGRLQGAGTGGWRELQRRPVPAARDRARHWSASRRS